MREGERGEMKEVRQGILTRATIVEPDVETARVVWAVQQLNAVEDWISSQHNTRATYPEGP